MEPKLESRGGALNQSLVHPHPAIAAHILYGVLFSTLIVGVEGWPFYLDVFTNEIYRFHGEPMVLLVEIYFLLSPLWQALGLLVQTFFPRAPAKGSSQKIISKYSSYISSSLFSSSSSYLHHIIISSYHHHHLLLHHIFIIFPSYLHRLHHICMISSLYLHYIFIYLHISSYDFI